MKPSPKSLLLVVAVMLASACINEPTPLAPNSPGEVLRPENRIIVGSEARANLLTEITGKPTTAADVDEMGIEATRIILAYGIEQTRRELGGLSGREAIVARRSIERREHQLQRFASVPAGPLTISAADGAQSCPEQPDIVSATTTQSISRPIMSPYTWVESTSEQSVDRDMRHFTLNTITIYNTLTSNPVFEVAKSHTSYDCRLHSNPVSNGLQVNENIEDADLLCAESTGYHRAWNDVYEEDEEDSVNARGCEHIIVNPGEPGDNIIPTSAGGRRSGG